MDPAPDLPLDPLVDRRTLLRLGGLSALTFFGAPWVRADEATAGAGGSARSLLFVWLQGGPSQLETWDPKPGTAIGGPTKAIPTRLPGVEIAADYPRLADRFDRLSLIRSLVTNEGEHQRGTYVLRTGYAPLPTVRRPSLGAVAAWDARERRRARGVEIPRHIAFLSSDPPRGGFLGHDYHAFAVGDPGQPLEDLQSPVGPERFEERLDALAHLEQGFRRGREGRLEDDPHADLARRARDMMASEQMAAFRVDEEPAATREAYGDTAFGRSLLAARRLVEVGVPAVEVTLGNWDSHAANFSVHTGHAETLDRGLAALLDDLAERGLLRSTLVVCGGEFGRTPRINGLEGRDHWTRGFSYLIGGGGLRSGVVIGETDPAGEADPTDPVAPRDLAATIFHALGVERSREFYTAAGRPVVLNEGAPLRRLLG